MNGAAGQSDGAQPPSPCPVCGQCAPGRTVIRRSPDRQHGVAGRFDVWVCANCGAGTTLPAVADERLGELYPDEEYEPYLAPGGRIVAPLMRAIAAARSRAVPFDRVANQPTGRMLDVGCGRGDIGAAYVDRGWRVDGVEISEAACAVARSQGLDARCGTLATVAVESDCYDVVAFRHVLEHLNDPVADLGRALDALRPGGTLLVSLPNFSSWQRRLFGSRWFALELPRHRVHFTPPSLELALSRAGYEAIKLNQTSSVLVGPASLQYALFGRCVFPDGWRLNLGRALSVLLYPVTWSLGKLLGSGDFLHAIASRPR